MKYFLVAAITTSLAGSAHADDLFPVEGDFEFGFASGAQAWTSNVYFSLSIVRTIAPVGNHWRLFGGIGLSDDVTTLWQRHDRAAPDAIGAMHAPGVEARVGLVRGPQVGAPRFVLKLTPQWANGAEINLPSDRGFGMRMSAGFAWPSWLLGRVEPDAPGTRSDEQTEVFRLIGAALIPSEIEYVFTVIPGDTRHGIAFGWSF